VRRRKKLMTEQTAPPIPDLRVARVLEARDHPNADRLLVMRIDLGSEERQIVAGIVGHYELEELEGLPIVVVANLQPAKLRGEVSQGMLLAAENDEGRLGLLLAPNASPGTPVRGRETPPPAEEISFQEFHQNTLLAEPQGVTLNGSPLEGIELAMDRDVYGKLR
jgi:methionine--tRNA ligase beta chain